MKSRYLIVSTEGSEKTISLVPEVTNLPNNYKISPIFSVFDDAYEPADNCEYVVGFLFTEFAFKDIGSLCNSLHKEYLRYIWVSHGLASIVIISDTPSIFSEIQQTDIFIRGYESFNVSSTKVLSPDRLFLCDPEPIDFNDFQVASFDVLEDDLKWVITEFNHSNRTAAYRASQYAPSQLMIFRRLAETVVSIVNTLVSITSREAEEIDVHTKKRFDFLASQLVQINSALSYIISQGYSGIIPVLEHDCHVRTYSLLGIGVCYRALSAFARHVELVFEKHPVAEVIKRTYESSISPEVSSPGVYDPALWDKMKFGIDVHLNGSTFPSEDNPKLVYYSGRQGFRETKFTVSAPINSLSAASSVRWSLMTLSHELMHAHVMSVLAAIFGNMYNPQEFAKLVTAFNDYRNRNSAYTLNLRHGLAFIILEYCLFMDGVSKRYINGKKVVIQEADSRDPAVLQELVSEHFGDINEIVVHVLDYIYFYDRSDDVYIGLLWESWSPVPVVLEKIESYILRTLIAVGSKETGLPTQRYYSSIKTVKRSLNQLLEKNPSNVVIKHAIEILENNNNGSSKLLLQFSGGIYLADMADRFLASTEINAKLLQDPMRTVFQEDEALVHRMLLEIGQFEATNIHSPVALLEDLLRRALENEIKVSGDVASVWAFITCASFQF